MSNPPQAVEPQGAEEDPSSLDEGTVERISKGAPSGQRVESERSALLI